METFQRKRSCQGLVLRAFGVSLLLTYGELMTAISDFDLL
jgi:hypothetical protein